MRSILTDRLLGILLGMCLGYMGSNALGLLVAIPAVPGAGSLVFALLGGICGGIIGSYLDRPAAEGGAVARWCAGMTAVVGGLGFLLGFVGPLVLHPDRTKGPLLGYLITGPLGAVAGAVLGVVLGLLRQRAPRSASP